MTSRQKQLLRTKIETVKCVSAVCSYSHMHTYFPFESFYSPSCAKTRSFFLDSPDLLE